MKLVFSLKKKNWRNLSTNIAQRCWGIKKTIPIPANFVLLARGFYPTVYVLFLVVLDFLRLVLKQSLWFYPKSPMGKFAWRIEKYYGTFQDMHSKQAKNYLSLTSDKKPLKNHTVLLQMVVILLQINYLYFSLKGQSNEIFYLRFFHRWTSPKPLTRYLKTFRI